MQVARDKYEISCGLVCNKSIIIDDEGISKDLRLEDLDENFEQRMSRNATVVY